MSCSIWRFSGTACAGSGALPAVRTSRYSHNALGQRTFKALPITTSLGTADPGYAFTYNEDGTLIGEYGAAGTPSAGTTEYIWLPLHFAGRKQYAAVKERAAMRR